MTTAWRGRVVTIETSTDATCTPSGPFTPHDAVRRRTAMASSPGRFLAGLPSNGRGSIAPLFPEHIVDTNSLRTVLGIGKS